ncbi:hypothetical protein G7Y89_g10065 [Cudoniella acicularis]|uniref:Uncharacterized protein n=1 Tax=Cudoniella acicularis TaxID=354080 RepID=A0A8H4RFS3_9HELO|nr:hypothetical protein G7Y89_g10065 [Cudoniella acicularis]
MVTNAPEQPQLRPHSLDPNRPTSPDILRKLPFELREMIFIEVLDWDGRTPPLLAALRPDPELYSQALAIFRKNNYFRLHSRSGLKMSKETKANIFKVQVLIQSMLRTSIIREFPKSIERLNSLLGVVAKVVHDHSNLGSEGRGGSEIGGEYYSWIMHYTIYYQEIPITQRRRLLSKKPRNKSYTKVEERLLVRHVRNNLKDIYAQLILAYGLSYRMADGSHQKEMKATIKFLHDPPLRLRSIKSSEKDIIRSRERANVLENILDAKQSAARVHEETQDHLFQESQGLEDWRNAPSRGIWHNPHESTGINPHTVEIQEKLRPTRIQQNILETS